MQRKPNSHALVAAFLAVSAALSVAVLAARNLYDDEIMSLDLITGSVSDILRTNAAGDVHPPGMYLLAHFAYRIVPSFRWMDIFPCLFLYAGLAIFLVQVTPLFASLRSRVCLLLLATMHPQLLLWSTTFRWYSWWTGIALIALTVALQPRKLLPVVSAARSLTIGILLSCLFYLNYITFLFALALGIAMLLRYRAQTWKHLLLSALLIAGAFFALIAPQLHTMVAVHIPDGQAQRYSIADSTLRLLQSVVASEAYLPWHPLAILAGLLFAAFCMVGAIALLRLWRKRSSEVTFEDSPLASIILFGLLFFVLVAVTGLGGKPRNGLLLIPVLAPAAALVVGTLRPRVQNAILIFFALWSGVGIVHMLGRYGITKAMMNDHPDEVVNFIRQTRGAGCAAVVTYDTGLTFSLAQANLTRVLIVSIYDPPVFGSSNAQLPIDCTSVRLYAVQSYVGGNGDWESTLAAELQSATQFIQGQPHTNSFSFDPDAAHKRSLSRIHELGSDLAAAGRLPDYRYVVTSGLMDPANVEVMRQRMPDFTP